MGRRDDAGHVLLTHTRNLVTERNVTVSMLAKNEQAARELMDELAPDHRVVAITASLGDGKYLIPERWSESDLEDAIAEQRRRL